MWEIVSRAAPYENEEFGPNGRFLRQRIGGGLRPSIEAIQPALHRHAYVDLMERCWAAAREDRPDFDSITRALETMAESDEWVALRHGSTTSRLSVFSTFTVSS